MESFLIAFSIIFCLAIYSIYRILKWLMSPRQYWGVFYYYGKGPEGKHLEKTRYDNKEDAQDHANRWADEHPNATVWADEYME